MNSSKQSTKTFKVSGTSMSEIQNIINILDANGSYGQSIPTKIIIFCSNESCPCLAHSFNNAINIS